MLKKINRLSSVRLAKYSNISTPFFNAKKAPNDSEFPRFAFVISKKIDKRAVVRNSLKRKFSSCIEEIFDRIDSGNDFVLYPNTRSVEAPREKVLEELKKVLIKND